MTQPPTEPSAGPHRLSEHEHYVLKRLVWHGFLRRRDIEQLLRVSSDYASRLIGRIKAAFNLQPVGKGYRLAGPVPPPITANEYLDDVLRALAANLDVETTAGADVRALAFSLRNDHVQADVLRDLVFALRSNEAIGIAYTGMAHGETTRLRVIEPVALIHVDHRWHLHAWARPSHGREGGWRDFVLARITETHGSFGAAEHRFEDSEGMRSVQLQLAPHPDLTADQAKVVGLMWGMTNGRLSIDTTESQAFYFCKAYVADDSEGPPGKLLIQHR